MENASKALLIAGAILLAIMILTVGIILYRNFSDTTEIYSYNLSTIELDKFNTKFEVFRGRKDITAQEIASLINIVVEYKKKTPINVVVIVNDIPYGESDNTIDFLKDNLYDEVNDKIITFECENIGYNSVKEVNSITFRTAT